MKNLVPKRRFEEFKDSDPWEQRKLGDIGEFKSNGVDKKINKNDFSVCLLNYMDVYNRINLTNGNRNKLMQVTATTKQIEANNIEANDVFFTPSSETADDIGRVMVVEETLENTVYSYHLMRFRPHKNIFYSIFPNYVFETTFFRKQMILEAQGVQRFVLNRDAFENLIVTMPELKEQKLISEFFRSLDNLITLHQHKLDKLKETKSAYLSEMFPKEGEVYPKRRFAGFTDPWEQRKLKDMTDYKNGKGHEDRQSDSGKYELVNLNSISIDGGLKPSGKFVDHTTDTLLENDLVMVLSDVGHGDLLGRVALIPRDGRFVLNQRVALLRPNGTVEPQFLFSYINAHQRYFKSQGAGMSQLNISKGSVENFVLYVPKKEEQVKIGTLFKNLDNLIILHQRKLDKLQALKQAYLSEMFV